MSPRAPPANELNALEAPMAPRIPNCVTPLRVLLADQPIAHAPRAMRRGELSRGPFPQPPRGPFPQPPRGPFPQPQCDVVAYGPAGAMSRIAYVSAADSRSRAILPDIRRYCREEGGRELPKEEDRGLGFRHRHVKDECSLCKAGNGCPWAEHEEERGRPKEEGGRAPQGPLPATHAQSRLESAVDEDRLPASLEESVRMSQALREKLERDEYV